MPSSLPRSALLLIGMAAGCTAVRPTAGPTSAPATAPADPALAALRDEGLNRSKVADTADYLCNVIGPRLTASPALRRANEWTRDTLARWGLTDAHLEPWGPFGRGWTMERFSFGVIAPYAFEVVGAPKAWSPGFERELESDVVYIDTKTEAGLADYADRMAGQIVLIGNPRPIATPFEAPATRLDDARLAAMATPPAKDRSAELLRAATRPATMPSTGPATTPSTQPTTATAPSTRPAVDLGAFAFYAKALAFATTHGAACVVTPSGGGDGRTVFVAQATVPGDTPREGPAGATTQPRAWWPDPGPVPPQVAIAAEDFNRIVAIARRNIPVRASIDLKVRFTDEMPQQYVTVAEIPGTDLAGQIVMVGGHLDSWHSATGATDNAAGVVAAMEAARLITACHLHPRRTIRVALWTGEEQGLLGSTAYVKAHFGSLPDDAATTRPATGPTTRPTTTPIAGDAVEPLAVRDVPATRPAPRPGRVVRGAEYERLSVYFNLDNGTGKIRGIYAQNNAAAVPIFKTWLAPLRDLGVTTVSPENTGFTDHISFDRIGLPGFQFIQDPIDYSSRSHHSNVDTYDRLQIDDLKQAAVVMATCLWDAANANERFPRKVITP